MAAATVLHRMPAKPTNSPMWIRAPRCVLATVAPTMRTAARARAGRSPTKPARREANTVQAGCRAVDGARCRQRLLEPTPTGVVARSPAPVAHPASRLLSNARCRHFSAAARAKVELQLGVARQVSGV